MPEIHHHVQLVIEHGELRRKFVCTAPEDAPCRRRPENFEATKAGYPCWAVDWVEAVGIEDAILAFPDQVLASVPVEIRYSEGVEITPAVSVQGEPSDVQVLDALNAWYAVERAQNNVPFGSDADDLSVYSPQSQARMRAALRAAGVVSVQGEPEWTPTLDHNDTHELTISADCDGSNLRHYRRTPKRVIPAGPWLPVQAPEGEEES